MSPAADPSSDPSSNPRPGPDPLHRRRGGRDASDTKAKLLDAAGRLFAERGYAGTSMRAVTQAAGVSVSAANYHFGSKEALLLATFGQVVLPVNRARIERLDALERSAGSEPPLLEAVVDAFLAPAVERRDAASGQGRFRELAARLYMDPPEVVAAFKEENFAPLSERFTIAIQRVLPDHKPDEIALAFQFMVGMMVHVIAGQLEIGSPLPGDNGRPQDDDALLDSMIRFAVAGFRATPARETTS